MPDPFKRRRVDGTPGGNAAGAALLLAKELPSSSANVIAQLVSLDGTSTGPQLDLPSDVTPGQLGELLNGLLRNEERTPYAFYCAGSELHSELGPHLHKAQASVEGVLQITYQARGRLLVGRKGGERLGCRRGSRARRLRACRLHVCTRLTRALSASSTVPRGAGVSVLLGAGWAQRGSAGGVVQPRRCAETGFGSLPSCPVLGAPLTLQRQGSTWPPAAGTRRFGSTTWRERRPPSPAPATRTGCSASPGRRTRRCWPAEAWTERCVA
jgi:hypothetical protein